MTEFKTWGTSLAWWSNIKYPKEIIDQQIDLVFGKGNLNMKFARYNLGGGYNPELTQNFRLGGKMECLITETNDEIDFSRDPFQMSVLDDIVEKGITRLELFSNSPPFWMTKSGYTNGSVKSFTCNLKDEYIHQFVMFIVNSYNAFKKRYPQLEISIAPFNEPSNPFWTVKATSQEGCFFGYRTRIKIIKAIKEINKDIFLSGVDEFSSGFGLLWYLWSPKKLIDRINVHGYHLKWKEYTFYFDDFNIWRHLLRLLTKKDIFMSEYSWGYPDTMKETLPFARKVFRDLQTLKPQGWAYWQVIEHTGSGDWGLLQCDFNNPISIVFKKSFFIMKHFTRVLKGGDIYKFLNNNILQIENETELKFIFLNDSDKILDLSNVTELKVINLTNYIPFESTDFITSNNENEWLLAKDIFINTTSELKKDTFLSELLVQSNTIVSITLKKKQQ